MRTFYRICLLILCLSLLNACTTQSSPGEVTSSSGACAPTGKTQTAISPSLVPTAQGDWPMFRGDIMRSGSIASGGGSKLTQAWSYCTGSPVSASPVVHNGMVYIGSLAKTLTALDIHTGKKVWQIQASDAFYSTPVIENGIVYAAA